VNSLSGKFINAARWSFALILVLCALGTQARAQNDNQSVQPSAPPASTQTEQPQQPVGPVLSLMEALNLTPEQRQQLVVISQQHGVEIAAARQRLQVARRALNQAIYTDNPDQNIVSERTRDVVAAQDELIRLNTQAEFKVRQVLTPEQLKTFREIRRQQQRERRRLQGLPDAAPRRLPRERIPGANQQPNALPKDVNNSNVPLTPRERRMRRQQLRNQRRTPRP
jgi:Spy/CpxP family protein refolding chaperone